MRQRKKRGGRKSQSEEANHFDPADYDATMHKYREWFDNQLDVPPNPDNPVGIATISMYKTVLKMMWKDQFGNGNCNRSWAHIWRFPLEDLHNWVKRRQCEINKRTYKEKVDHDFAPYQAVEHFHSIEEEMWRRGHGCIRSGFAWIRHRFCLLFTTSGILRCESLFKAELSDFLGIAVKKETDAHKIYIMIMQMATGKYELSSK